MSSPKSNLIEKLEAISSLYKKAILIREKMDSYEPDDTYKREIVVPVFPGEYKNKEDRERLLHSVDHTDDDAIDQMSDAFDALYHPKKPQAPKKPNYSAPNVSSIEGKEKSFGCFSYVVLGIAGFFALGSIVGVDANSTDARPIILTIAAIGAAAFVVLKFYAKKMKAEKDKINARERAKYDSEIAEIDDDYKKALAAYEAECDTYRPVRDSFLDQYAVWRDVYLESVEEEDEIAQKLEADRQAAVEKIKAEEFSPLVSEIAEINDIVATEYLIVLDDIIDLLRSGRADDLKEAINLYEDIQYRERQLEFEREKETQRAYEEEQRRQDDERRHREDMELRAEQERNRAREAQDQLRMQKEQHDAEMKLQRDRLKQEADIAKANRQKRCVWCAHNLTCRQQYYDGAYNCTGFTPKN